MEEVINFIERFAAGREIFVNGCCYWFAEILSRRFDGEIMYDIVDNHFTSEIDNRLYDITGDVTDIYTYAVPWDDYQDEIHKNRIIHDCIL